MFHLSFRRIENFKGKEISPICFLLLDFCVSHYVPCTGNKGKLALVNVLCSCHCRKRRTYFHAIRLPILIQIVLVSVTCCRGEGRMAVDLLTAWGSQTNVMKSGILPVFETEETNEMSLYMTCRMDVMWITQSSDVILIVEEILEESSQLALFRGQYHSCAYHSQPSWMYT